jgi:hypothetical protein
MTVGVPLHVPAELSCSFKNKIKFLEFQLVVMLGNVKADFGELTEMCL